MKQIGATADGSQRYEQGKGVRVGIIDTGVDGTHPDIAPNFDAALSRNFTTDIPVDANGAEIDGPCEHPSCVDPPNDDDNGHGTHVASEIASPINRLGIAGVAPKATIVNLRAGQDSGYFFLQPSVDALTYAGDHGIDVVNMSYYVDPWLFNCTNNPADSPEDQAEQRTVITAMQRALDYAHRHGVTLVAAAGNGATDYTKTIEDASSPDFADVPGEAPYERTIPPSCISMPSEGNHVLSISSTGISQAQGVLLGLRQRLRRPVRARRRRLRHGRQQARHHEGRARRVPEAPRRGGRPAQPRRDAERPQRRARLPPQRHLRVLPVPAGHVDGVAARRRRGRADRGPLGRPRPARRRQVRVPGRRRAADARDGDEHSVPDAAGVHVHPPGPAARRDVPDRDGDARLRGHPTNNGFYGDGIVNAKRVARGF